MKSPIRFLVLVLVFICLVAYIVLNYFSHLWDQTGTLAHHNHEKEKQLLNNLGRSDKEGLIVSLDQQNSQQRTMSNHNPTDESSKAYERTQEITVAVVACGDRLDETLTMIKSAILFTRSPLQFVVVADEELIPSFKEKLNEWKIMTNNSFTFEVLPIAFPETENAEEWRKLFKPCASQRLFLPTILKHIDSVLYVDTDTLFLSPLEDTWRHFSLMNSSQMAALAPEHEDPNVGWYNRFARHPFYGKMGVNSGVMLMNLTRMRAFSWTEYVVPIYKQYKLSIIWGDQDIINIIFHYHPDKLYVYPCRYNYRSDHCMYMSVCKSAEKWGVAVMHGSRSSFHGEKQPAFRAVHKAMQEYQLGSEPYASLYLPMRNYLDTATASNCGKVQHIFTKAMESFIKKPLDMR